MTTYDAIRVIQDGDDIKLKLNDATFSRTTCEQNCENPTVGRFVPYTMAEDCANGSRGIAGSYASLEGSPLRFPSDVESIYVASGTNGRATVDLFQDGQYLRVGNYGNCALTYFTSSTPAQLGVIYQDDHPAFGDHLLTVNF